MTIATNTFTSYAAKGIREELSDVIYNISPEETPFMSNAGKDSMSNTFTEWQQDALASADNTNAQLEADDITSYDAVTATVRVGNYAQISRKTVVIGDTEEVVNKAGRNSELAYQIAKKSAELKRDMETILVGTNQAGVAGNSTTARKTGSMLATLKTNIDKGTGAAADPVWATFPGQTSTRVDGTQRAFTETILKNVMQLCWTAGAAPSTLMVGAVNKQVVSGFAGIATKTYNMTAAKVAAIIGAADVYVSDFGVLSVVPNRFQRARDAWFLNFDYIKLAYLRKFKQVPLAKTGDAEKRMLIVEYGLKVMHEAANGLAADLS